MNQRFGASLLAALFLVCAVLAQDCDWDQSTDPDQGLDPASVDAGTVNLTRLADVSDPESCRAACCAEPDCDLALVGYPADGGPQCMLVSCVIRGQDVCVLEPSTQFKVYRKATTETRTEAKEDGESPHVVPLLGSLEPRTNMTNNIRCRLPKKVGSCRAAFPRFYYDVINQSCHSFIYGGCEANENHFESQEDCEATCSGVTGSVLPDESTPAPPQLPFKAARMAPAFKTQVSQESEGPVDYEPADTESEKSAEDFAEYCGAEPDVGPCKAAFPRWYYSSETGSCQPFIYGGCRGNKNNHMSKESCIAACTVTVLPSSKKASSDDIPAEHKARCMATPDPGPCRAAFLMFYYDPKTETCQSFTYGGCHGNQNRYGNVEECMTRCSGNGWVEGHGRGRNRWTAAVFLFVTLAAVSALLLAALIIITLRRHSLSRRPSYISDKEELLPEPDEHSSMESLTVPESPKLDKI
ncbi:kunitz-type protease inhibitor 2 [Micropterus salmoides]|uniref:kunitz-type protease inhibitor 2 n=1 Tax=Micropterus salmoides TaxID=27706 RepID=UPI0018EB7A3C|nr:kunitz-type protease inhibitor 2 [Micropterus salmoides]